MTTATLADIKDIKARIAERDAAEAQASADYAEMMVPAVRPLLKVVDSYIDYIQNPEGRIMTGFHDIDLMTRGLGKGELCFIYGQLHQGKTVFLLNVLAHNHDKRILFYTPDEMAEEVLTKLVAIYHRVDLEVFERKIRDGDDEAIELLKQTATKDFPYLAILDTSMGFKKLKEVILQLEDEVWGAPVDIFAADYLGLFPGYTDEAQAAKALKVFTKNERLTTYCIQQSRKDEERRGQFRGVHGMVYGGQNEAHQLIEVIRPGDKPTSSQYDRINNQDVLGWNLCKNKRPPCKKGSGKLYMHPRFGALESWGPEHMQAPV